ncbi:MAG: filamentous hemagglutinin, partial [Gammaproteobacteria bacterium]
TAALPHAALVPGRNFPAASRGQLLFGAELLEGSGIESLYLGADPRLSGIAPPVPVTLGAGVSLALDRLISINTSVLAAGPGATAVALSAPYIALHGYVPGGVYTAAAPLPAAPDGVSLLLEAGNIDLGGQFALRGFGTASFRADGDIRLLTPSSYAYAASGENLTETVAVPGLLLTGGDLVFESARLYPATGNRFLISAVTPGATVRFTGNAASANAGAPLSAGGALLVSATNIEQGGTLMAPSGQIVLGVADPQDPATRALFSYPGLNRRGDPANILVPLVATERVRLLDGSLSSVSLDGLTVPYGRTVDGQNWRYDGSATSLAGAATSVPDLAAQPAKRITLAGADVLTDEGARIDLSGGGDLQASEWVAGTGGSRDVLGRFNTVYAVGVAQAVPLYADAREVYALVPGFAGPAPYDPAIVAGDPLIGQSVYLSGTNGLPEGVYTLLPARYATLPGAWRLVQDTAALDAVAGTNLQLPDGTRVVAGHFVDALDGSRDARSTRFLLQPGDTWRQYSQYELSSANVFFGADEVAARVRLPIDAGQLTLAASRSLGLGAQLLTEAGGGGSGALVDIASRRLQIVDADAVALPDHVQLRVSDLLALDAASLLIGGTREREDEAD